MYYLQFHIIKLSNFFPQIFCSVAIVGLSLVSSATIDAEILNALSKLDASQMNQAEAERVEKSFGSLFAAFGKGGGGAKNATTTTTTTTARTPIKEENRGMNTYRVVAGVLAAIKIILLKLNPSEDQPLVLLVTLLQQGLNDFGRHIFKLFKY